MSTTFESDESSFIVTVYGGPGGMPRIQITPPCTKEYFQIDIAEARALQSLLKRALRYVDK